MDSSDKPSSDEIFPLFVSYCVSCWEVKQPHIDWKVFLSQSLRLVQLCHWWWDHSSSLHSYESISMDKMARLNQRESSYTTTMDDYRFRTFIATWAALWIFVYGENMRWERLLFTISRLMKGDGLRGEKISSASILFFHSSPVIVGGHQCKPLVIFN